MNLLENNDQIQGQLVATDAGPLAFASLEVGLKILSEARHYNVNMCRASIVGLIEFRSAFQIYRAGGDDLRCLVQASLLRVDLEKMTPIPDAFERANFLLK